MQNMSRRNQWGSNLPLLDSFEGQDDRQTATESAGDQGSTDRSMKDALSNTPLLHELLQKASADLSIPTHAEIADATYSSACHSGSADYL
jgi:hypothetical protein